MASRQLYQLCRHKIRQLRWLSASQISDDVIHSLGEDQNKESRIAESIPDSNPVEEEVLLYSLYTFLEKKYYQKLEAQINADHLELMRSLIARKAGL